MQQNSNNTFNVDQNASFWPEDIFDMHAKFGVHEVVKKLTPEQLKSYLNFRLDMVQEEVTEARDSFNNKDADGVVDALIDNIIFAIGTLDVFGVDPYVAWNRVHQANMSKHTGSKPGRPNPFGFPDLIKPNGWQAPTHVDNIGLLSKIF